MELFPRTSQPPELQLLDNRVGSVPDYPFRVAHPLEMEAMKRRRASHNPGRSVRERGSQNLEKLCYVAPFAGVLDLWIGAPLGVWGVYPRGSGECIRVRVDVAWRLAHAL